MTVIAAGDEKLASPKANLVFATGYSDYRWECMSQYSRAECTLGRLETERMERPD